MIVHKIGEDSRHAFTVVDTDDETITAVLADFTVTNAAGVDIIEWTLADDTTVTGPDIDETFTVAVHLPDDLTRTDIADPVTAGVYAYRLRIQDTGGDWIIAANDLLRVTN